MVKYKIRVSYEVETEIETDDYECEDNKEAVEDLVCKEFWESLSGCVELLDLEVSKVDDDEEENKLD